MSQADLARAIPGLKEPRVGNYCQGTRYVGNDPSLLRKIAKVLEIPPGYLAALEDVEYKVIVEDELSLLNKYRGTDERGKRAIRGVADAQPASSNHHNGDNQKAA